MVFARKPIRPSPRIPILHPKSGLAWAFSNGDLLSNRSPRPATPHPHRRRRSPPAAALVRKMWPSSARSASVGFRGWRRGGAQGTTARGADRCVGSTPRSPAPHDAQGWHGGALRIEATPHAATARPQGGVKRAGAKPIGRKVGRLPSRYDRGTSRSSVCCGGPMCAVPRRTVPHAAAHADAMPCARLRTKRDSEYSCGATRTVSRQARYVSPWVEALSPDPKGCCQCCTPSADRFGAGARTPSADVIACSNVELAGIMCCTASCAPRAC